MKSSRIEPLEARIAPAVILTFTDGVDGDTVKLMSDKALTATLSVAANGSPSEILITGAGLDGASLTTVVTRAAGGDGLVNIGRIVATGLDLGAVTISGDLGKIVAGNNGSALPALKSLKVRSLGAFGLDTQTAGDLNSMITGDLGLLDVKGDVTGRLIVAGKVGTVKIGGDLRGGAAVGTGKIEATSFGTITIGGDLAASAFDETGKIVTSGSLGALTIKGSVFGALDMTSDATAQIDVGGNAGPIFIGRSVTGAISEQRTIDVAGNAGAITVGGSIIGGAGRDSGGIFVGGNAGLIKIGRSLEGGMGDFSAAIDVTGTAAGFTVGGDLIGREGHYQTGFIIEQVTFGSVTGAVRIGGDLVGGTGRGSAVVDLGAGAKSFFLGGSIIGGGSDIANSLSFPGAAVDLGSVPTVTIGGDLRGSAFGGGQVNGAAVGKLLIKGSLIAAPKLSDLNAGSTQVSLVSLGTGRIEGSIVGSPDATTNSFSLTVSGNVGALTIVGSLQGDAGDRTGSLQIGGDVGALTIGGSLLGGSGHDTATIIVNGRVGAFTVGSVNGGAGTFNDAQVRADAYGKVLVRGDLIGGGTGGAGSIGALAGGFNSVTVNGSLLASPQGAFISATGALGVVKIGGDVIGSNGLSLYSIRGLSAKSITVGGDLVDTGGQNHSLILIGQSAGKVSIGGDIRGPAQNSARLLFGTEAAFAGLGFTSLFVKGSVSNALIGGGIRFDLFGSNGDAQLGAVTVLGDWTASSIVASAARGADLDFATGDDTAVASNTPVLSRIAAITIGGQVLGTAAMNDGYGFTAQSIGPVKIAGVNYVPGANAIPLGKVFDDVTLRLV